MPALIPGGQFHHRQAEVGREMRCRGSEVSRQRFCAITGAVVRAPASGPNQRDGRAIFAMQALH